MPTTDPTKPDYVCPAYREMESRWTLVEDIRTGTDAVRAKKETYVPKFEAETVKDWDARVKMSFVQDHYATTLEEHVGMVMADPIKLGADVPKPLVPLTEDIDGEGNHLDVFSTQAFDAALHLGHCVLWTDYPQTDNIRNRGEERAAQVRPYVQLYKANDVLNGQFVAVGGVRVLTRIVLRETTTEDDGEFGTKSVVRIREIRQAVNYDEFTGRAKSLGAITWRAWKYVPTEGGDAAAATWADAGSGTISGPQRIPARVVYGGEKLGPLHSKPHLYGLAMTNLEETQVASDYAAVMHKCNVPTPIFIGRPKNDGTTTIQMGQGIDIPIGGDGKFMEPAGTAIAATRTRLQDLRLQMQRQGATMPQGEGGPALSATEAAQYAKARNAKLRKAARSLQDALEGVLADMAAFMGIATKTAPGVKSGGSVAVTQNFAGVTLDPAYLGVLVVAYREGVLTIEELRYVLQQGEFPETFDPEDVLALVAAESARLDREAADAQAEKDRAADEERKKGEKEQPPIAA